MTAEKIEVTIKRPWLFRALLVLFGAAAGSVGTKAIAPPAVAPAERTVTIEKPVIVEKPVLVPCSKTPVYVLIDKDVKASVKAPK